MFLDFYTTCIIERLLSMVEIFWNIHLNLNTDIRLTGVFVYFWDLKHLNFIEFTKIILT